MSESAPDAAVVTSTPVASSPSTASAAPRVERVQVASSESPAPSAAPAPSAPAAAPEDQRTGRRFAELARRSRELVQKEQALKEREAKVSPIQAAIEAQATNPMAVLEAAGLTYEQLTDFILSADEGGTASPTVEDKLNALEQKLADKEAADAAAAQRERDASVQKQTEAFKDSIREAAAASPDFELVHSMGQHDLVYSVVLEHHASTGEVLPLQDALKLTESYLESQAQRLLSAQKLRAPAAPQASPASRPEPVKTPFTLSQSQAPVTPVAASQNLTPEQARERAMALLRFS